MSNFSFSLSVFKRLLLQTRKNQGLFGKGLMPSFIFQQKQNEGHIFLYSITDPEMSCWLGEQAGIFGGLDHYRELMVTDVNECQNSCLMDESCWKGTFTVYPEQNICRLYKDGVDTDLEDLKSTSWIKICPTGILVQCVWSLALNQIIQSFHTLPNDRMEELSKLKETADNNFSLA